MVSTVWANTQVSQAECPCAFRPWISQGCVAEDTVLASYVAETKNHVWQP